jgi:hypothetical protein
MLFFTYNFELQVQYIDLHRVFILQDMKKFEAELRNLQAALEQAQTTLTSPEVGRLSLKEQLSHRQVSKNNLR